MEGENADTKHFNSFCFKTASPSHRDQTNIQERFESRPPRDEDVLAIRELQGEIARRGELLETQEGQLRQLRVRPCSVSSSAFGIMSSTLPAQGEMLNREAMYNKTFGTAMNVGDGTDWMLNRKPANVPRSAQPAAKKK